MNPGILRPLASKHFERWLGGFVLQQVRSWLAQEKADRPRHLLFALCDHHEPLFAGDTGKASRETGLRRVQTWRRQYPLLADRYRDADGRPPRHTFFFPIEEYHPTLFEPLDELVQAGYGEIEVHLHHDGDDASSLERVLRDGLTRYASHGHLARTDRGEARYAFIHGDWALCNGRPDGRFCGVDTELDVLHRTGCYADLTFPSCPDVTQSNQVNRLYWTKGDLRRRRAYAWGTPARVGDPVLDRPLFITGPLGFGWHDVQKRPRLEVSAITAQDPATPSRVQSWARCNIHVAGQANWVFVKAHTHGAPEDEAASLLGQGGDALHSALATFNDGQDWCLHYVTAREMFNIALAAIAGRKGNPDGFRDFSLRPPPLAAGARGR